MQSGDGRVERSGVDRCLDCVAERAVNSFLDSGAIRAVGRRQDLERQRGTS